MARKQREGKVKGFLLSFVGDNNERVFLKFTRDHHAEQVLRGLVHSGYEVTLSEEVMDMPERFKAISDYEEGWTGENEYAVVESPVIATQPPLYRD